MNARATQMRVILVDDRLATLAQPARRVGELPQIVGTVTHGFDSRKATVRLDLGLMFLRITLPGLEGFGAAQRLKQSSCRNQMVFRTVREEADHAKEAITAGADACVANRGSPPRTRAAPGLTAWRNSNPISQQFGL